MRAPGRPHIIALTLVSALLIACGGDDDVEPTSPAGPAESPTSAQTQEPSDLADGRHAAYIATADVAGRTVTIDVVEFLTGDAAVEAYAEEQPEDPNGPPNDYYIRNVNPRLRTMPVADDVAVTVVWLGAGGADTEEIGFEDLPAYFATGPEPDGPYEWWAPFWFTLSGGVVTAIEEQFIP